MFAVLCDVEGGLAREVGGGLRMRGIGRYVKEEVQGCVIGC